tara:strand:+ start:3326 stop:4105 length:780 start_codon:yes stop_codon:yes gene_type:complete
MTLAGKTIASAYKSLLRVNDDTNGVDAVPERVTDGEGTSSALRLSDDQVQVNPVNDETTSAFSVKAQSGTQLFVVDSTNSLVKANGHSVTTQYASFHMNSTWFSTAADDTHTALAFNAQNLAAILGFGTGTDPATSFTTAEGTGTRAGELVPCLWYVPDNIKILGVTSLEGADAATGDTTRMHLMSYTFSSGSTSALSSGTVLAYNADVTNAGSEQAYKSDWTVSSSDVSAGKVIMAFLKSDSINSDYSASVFIKYILV